MSLRARIAIAAAVAAAIVMVVAGAFIVRLTERDQRNALDQQLSSQARVLSGPLTRAAGSSIATVLQQLGATGVDGDRTIRVVSPDGAATLTLGATLPGSVGLLSTGTSTVVIDGQRFRAYAVSAGTARPLLARRQGQAAAQVQVIAPLRPLEDQARSIRRRVLFIGALAVLALVILAWISTGVALSSLRRLQGIADRVTRTEDLSLRLEPLNPPEVGAVVAAFNAMLTRLDTSTQQRQQALDTARAFAADAMHELRTPLTSMGANLESLAGGSEADHGQLLQGVIDDHARIVTTLEALHSLTVAELLPSEQEPVDLADLIELIGHESTRRHPRLVVAVDLPLDPVMVTGSRESLRMLIDNLLTNAERHGRPDGITHVEVRADRQAAEWIVTVDDDGRGFPVDVGPDQLLGRFVRSADSSGSGLGLAIVSAQARRHGGSLRLGRSPLGGARVQVVLPAN